MKAVAPALLTPIWTCSQVLGLADSSFITTLPRARTDCQGGSEGHTRDRTTLSEHEKAESKRCVRG